MAELFGFSFKKKAVKERAPSPVQPSSEDGATSYIAGGYYGQYLDCLLYTSPSPRDNTTSRMPSSA